MASPALLSSKRSSRRYDIRDSLCFQKVTDFDQSKSTTAIENIFPEVLRDPILRKVQFSTISRMDDLGTFQADVVIALTNLQKSTLSMKNSSATSFPAKKYW